LSNWDGSERRKSHNPDVCELRFRNIEEKIAGNYATLEHKIDIMSKGNDRVADLVLEVRQKIFNGYSETLLVLAHNMEKLEKRMQWWIGLTITFGVGLAISLMLKLLEL